LKCAWNYNPFTFSKSLRQDLRKVISRAGFFLPCPLEHRFPPPTPQKVIFSVPRLFWAHARYALIFSLVLHLLPHRLPTRACDHRRSMTSVGCSSRTAVAPRRDSSAASSSSSPFPHLIPVQWRVLVRPMPSSTPPPARGHRLSRPTSWCKLGVAP
jgi:hypothetical protein